MSWDFIHIFAFGYIFIIWFMVYMYDDGICNKMHHFGFGFSMSDTP